MQNIINFVCGSVLVEVNGAYPERFFNLCSRYGISIRGMENVGIGAFRVYLSLADFRRIRSVAKKSMCRVHILKKCGFPFFVRKFRKRNMLVFGLVLFCAAAWVFTNFVWQMEIDGFDGLDTEKLRTLLSESGLDIGSYSPSINLSELKNNVLIEMPELAYVSVNFNGARAKVTARKRTLPPDILPENVPCDIISDKDGIISDITVKTGTPEVTRGETIVKGQLLVSGYMTGRAGSTIITHADADIKARVWRKISARAQRNQRHKRYTGDSTEQYTLILFGNRIKLYQNSGILYTKCDKIIESTNLEIFGGIKFPIALERATYMEYNTYDVTADDEDIKKLLGDGLHEEMKLPDDAEISDSSFKTSQDETFMYGTLITESVEAVGEKREMIRNG